MVATPSPRLADRLPPSMVLKTQDYELAAVALKKELHKNAKTPPSKPKCVPVPELVRLLS